jgi:hypothetical protein
VEIPIWSGAGSCPDESDHWRGSLPTGAPTVLARVQMTGWRVMVADQSRPLAVWPALRDGATVVD